MAALRFRPDQIEQWPLSRLKPYERNPRLHSDDQVAKVAASIVKFGWTVPVLVTDDGEIVAGHGRLLAAQYLGLEEAPIIRIGHLDPDEVRGYRLADNQLVLAGEWNEEFLAGEVHELNAVGFDLSVLGFDEDFLDELMAPVGDGGDLPGEDVIPEPPANPVSRPGDLWVLGKHRLLCGDSTKAADVRRLMNGERAILFATDPPYLVDYDGTNHPGKTKADETPKNKDWSATYAVTWDDSSQGPELYEGFIKAAIDHAILPNAAWYCWHASRRQAMVEEVWVKCGAFVHQQIIWTKTKPVLVRMHYLWAHEPCFFGWVRPQQAAQGQRRVGVDGLAAAVARGRRPTGTSDAEAARCVRHPDAPARAPGRALLRAVQRLGLADHGWQVNRRRVSPWRSARSMSTWRCSGGRAPLAGWRCWMVMAAASMRLPASGCRRRRKAAGCAAGSRRPPRSRSRRCR